jgi:hypothetical protein
MLKEFLLMKKNCMEKTGMLLAWDYLKMEKIYKIFVIKLSSH